MSCLVGDSRRHIFSWRGSLVLTLSPFYATANGKVMKTPNHPPASVLYERNQKCQRSSCGAVVSIMALQSMGRWFDPPFIKSFVCDYKPRLITKT